MSNPSRIGSIDFWRGGVLIAILVDHIPGNVLESLTPRNFGLSDSAEAFVFLSGLSVGLVYLPRARKQGFESVALSCLQRALKLYGVHIGLTFAALAIFAAGYCLSGAEDLLEAHGRSLVFGSPASGVTGVALLSHQLSYFNILPLYIVLMLWAPLALAVALYDPRLALVSSACIYAGSRAFGLHLPSWPEPGGWFFNPFAWQFLFVVGATAGHAYAGGLPALPRWSWVWRAAIAVALACAVIKLSWIAHQLDGNIPALFHEQLEEIAEDKSDLSVLRLLSFFALTLAIVHFIKRDSAFLRHPLAGLVIRCGQHSLQVFCLGILLSVSGRFVINAMSNRALTQLAVDTVGIALMIVLAQLLSWYKNKNRAIAAAAPVAQASAVS